MIVVSIEIFLVTSPLSAGMDYCLRNKPRTLFDSPDCGNPCCDPSTCNMFPNATCATGECCDFKTCQPKSPGTVCR